MSEIAITPRAAADDDELFRLYRAVFGEALAGSSRRRWRWQYQDNPATPPSGPEIWVARDGSALLGQYASMPVHLRWGDREVRSSWGMDVFLSPAARGRGVGARLFTAWSDHVEVALGLGLTTSSYGLFQKLRYADVGPVPFYFRVLDPRAVAARRLGPRWAGVAGRLLGLGWRLRHPERRPRAGAADLALAPVTRFDARHDALWNAAGPSYAMAVRRDAAYLDWKYVQCPHRRYDIVEATRGATLAGFAVSRHEDHHGLRLGWIVDLFAHADDHAVRDALLGHVLDGFRQAGVARAQAFSMHGAVGEDLARHGFRRGSSPMQFCVRARIPSDAVFAAIRRWHVMFGDSDMDR
jgi:GNAT superfamily N-acetyltransferase